MIVAIVFVKAVGFGALAGIGALVAPVGDREQDAQIGERGQQDAQHQTIEGRCGGAQDGLGDERHDAQ